MKVWVTYGLSVLIYILITFVTKRLLTWNLALIYFVVTLEVLPRSYHRLRAAIAPTESGNKPRPSELGVDR